VIVRTAQFAGLSIQPNITDYPVIDGMGAGGQSSVTDDGFGGCLLAAVNAELWSIQPLTA
jgi:hypothetical protein